MVAGHEISRREGARAALTFRLSPEDLSRVRFAFSPLQEAVMSLGALSDPGRHVVHLPWVESTLEVLKGSGVDLGPALALTRGGGYIPDFLTPPPLTPLPTFEAEVDRLSRTPPETVEEEVGRLAEGAGLDPERRDVVEAFIADPEGSLGRLVEALVHYHEIAIAPHWPRMRALLEGDVLRRAQALAFGGPEALFADLHRSVRYREGLVEIDKECVRAEVRPSGRGVLLVPSIFAWPALLAVIEPPWQPTLLYPPRGTAKLWIPSPEEPGDALGEALGRGRASVLKGLLVPRTTTEVARQTGTSPGTASGHLSRLRRAGLVEPHRLGRSVFYRLSYEGEALLALFGEVE
jgi:DNA-binding transcriptional ArsR family regulator